VAQITLTIAGSDSSSGAGIQADLKTFSSLGVHGLTAVTCVVAESPHEVLSVTPVPAEAVIQQIQALTKAYPIGALKTGLLHSAETVHQVCDTIRKSSLSVAHLVVDPVIISSTGDTLAEGDVLSAYREQLLPLASVITPNIPEAEMILGSTIDSHQQAIEAATELAKIYNTACLLKGGHAKQSDTVTDILATTDSIREFSLPRIDIPMSHGTGCTLSAAITANLVKGQMLPTAVRNAKEWLHIALANSLHWKIDGKDTYCINQANI